MKLKTHLWDGLILFIIAAFLIVPLALTFLYSVFTAWMDILPTGFTLQFIPKYLLMVLLSIPY